VTARPGTRRPGGRHGGIETGREGGSLRAARVWCRWPGRAEASVTIIGEISVWPFPARYDGCEQGIRRQAVHAAALSTLAAAQEDIGLNGQNHQTEHNIGSRGPSLCRSTATSSRTADRLPRSDGWNSRDRVRPWPCCRKAGSRGGEPESPISSAKHGERDYDAAFPTTPTR